MSECRVSGGGLLLKARLISGSPYMGNLTSSLFIKVDPREMLLYRCYIRFDVTDRTEAINDDSHCFEKQIRKYQTSQT